MKRAIEYAQAIIAILWLLLLIVWLPGCAERIQYVTVPIQRETRPILPKVTAKELECLSKDAYQKLYDRQRLMGDYTTILETIIDAHNGTTAGR